MARLLRGAAAPLAASPSHLALSAEICTGTIDRIMKMSNAELGLKALLG